jgi:hypothetical protein
MEHKVENLMCLFFLLIACSKDEIGICIAIVSNISCKGYVFLKDRPLWVANAKKWGKNPLTLGWGTNAHGAKERADLGGQDLCVQIYGQVSIPDPLCHSTFIKRGGGGGGGSGIERTYLNGLDLGT